MNQEQLKQLCNEFSREARAELEQKKENKNSIIELFAEIKWTESSGIIEVSILNSEGISKILNGDTSEVEFEETITFNKDGEVPEMFLRPVDITEKTYITDIPALVTRYKDNSCDIIYPTLDKLFNNN